MKWFNPYAFRSLRSGFRCFLFATVVSLVGAFNPHKAAAQTQEYREVHQGNKAFGRKDYQGAAAHYLKALKINPANTRATFNLADTYLAKGDPQAADSLYTRVVQTERNKQIRSMAWHNRGYICQRAALENQEQQQQLLRQAIEHYKQALRLNPHDNDTRYNLALCQRQLKNNPDQNNKKNQQNKQQQQQQQQEKQKQSQQNKQNDPQQQKQKEQERQRTEQYLNLARQAEQRALERIKGQQPRQKSLQKNW